MAAKKTAVLLIIIIIIVIVLAYVFLVREKPPVEQPPEEEEIVPPAATGDIDDVVDALLKETADEASVLVAEEGDADLIDDDGQEISDFGQSIDENEL